MLTIAGGILLALFIVFFLDVIIGLGLVLFLIALAVLAFVGVWLSYGPESALVLTLVVVAIWLYSTRDIKHLTTKKNTKQSYDFGNDRPISESKDDIVSETTLKDMNFLQLHWCLYRSLGLSEFTDYLKVKYSIVSGDQARISRMRVLEKVLGAAEHKYQRLIEQDLNKKQRQLEINAAALKARLDREATEQERKATEQSQKATAVLNQVEDLLAEKLKVFIDENLVSVRRFEGFIVVQDMDAQRIAEVIVNGRVIIGNLYCIVRVWDGRSLNEQPPTTPKEAVKKVHKALRKQLL